MSFADEIIEQLDWHWRGQLRPRLEGLTDDEYFWEPAPGSWNVRRKDRTPGQPGAGEWTVDFAFPQPEPAPVTTIAWRLAHINCGILAMRLAGHFGAPPVDYGSYGYEGTAAEALRHLDEHYDAWVAGIRTWKDDDLAVPVGDAEPGFEESSRAMLVLHINRELIHHGAEISLLRDLYAARLGTGERNARS